MTNPTRIITPYSLRLLPRAMIEASHADTVVGPVLLVELDFASGYLRLTDAPFDITTPLSSRSSSTQEFVAVGDALTVSAFEEGAEVRPYSVQLQLQGVPSDLLTLALGEHYQGRMGRIYITFFTQTHELLSVPMVLFQGRMDNMSISLEQDTALSLTLKNLLADWENPRVKRYTSQSHAATDSTDRFFDFASRTSHQEINWGSF